MPPRPSFRLLLAFVAAGAVFGAAVVPVAAMEPGGASDRAVFGFGGQMLRSHMGEAFNPITSEYEPNYVIGGGYQQFLLDTDFALRIGAEFGAALRFGDESSIEAWAGVVGRYEGIVIGDTIRLTPALTFGMSAVDRSIGRERERAEGDGKDAGLLFYLSPELSISHADNPDLELFWRLHHRSSAWRSVGGGSANATTVGLRLHF